MSKRWFIIVALAAFGGVLHWCAVTSRANQLKALEVEASTLRARLPDTRTREEVAQLHQRLRQHNDALPMQGDVAGFLRELMTDLEKCQVFNRSLTTGVIRTEEPLLVIPFTLTFKSSFEAAYGLLARLYEYPRIVRVNRLVISREPHAATDSLSVSMHLETFARTTKEMPRWRAKPG